MTSLGRVYGLMGNLRIALYSSSNTVEMVRCKYLHSSVDRMRSDDDTRHRRLSRNCTWGRSPALASQPPSHVRKSNCIHPSSACTCCLRASPSCTRCSRKHARTWSCSLLRTSLCAYMHECKMSILVVDLRDIYKSMCHLGGPGTRYPFLPTGSTR